jgi:dipeptidyl aminopeptidase/acylaminoacyl peptidase
VKIGSYRELKYKDIRMIAGFSRFAAAAAKMAVTMAVVSPSLFAQGAASTTDLKYQTPPEVMVKLVDALPTPTVSLSPKGGGGTRWMLIRQSSSLPTIADLAQPELRLAGLRFNPKVGAPSRTRYAVSLKLQKLPVGGVTTTEIAIAGLPAKLHVIYSEWSPDGAHVALVQQDDSGTAAGLSLWVVDVAKAHATRVPGVKLNAVLTEPIGWLDSNSLAVLAMPANRGAEPVKSEIPTGPVIQENLGRATPAPTYEDLLKSPSDERIFEWNATSQIGIVKLAGGAVKLLGKPGVFAGIAPSPDGRFVLAKELHRPYSYGQTYDRFPERREVYTVTTGGVKVLDDAPLIDNLPIDRDAVEPGKREFEWRADAPATVAWVQAADGGDPKRESRVRDRLYELAAPFEGEGKAIADLPIRYRGVQWGNAHLAVVTELRWKDRKMVVLAVDPETGKTTALYEGSMQDRYHNPGRPLVEADARGQLVLQTTADGKGIYFTGAGASPKGDMPFVAVMPVEEKAVEKKIWQSAAPFFETPIAVVNAGDGVAVLARRESVEMSPNYFLSGIATDAATTATWTQVTKFPNPYAGLPMPSHELLHYKRADGVDLTADLYLPGGYKKGDAPLPTLMEAYPAEFKSRAAAAQVTGSPYEFVRITAGSPVFFATTGYAVLANAAIPIIGEGTAEPNDTYVEQLVAGAKAGIDAGAATGAVDAKRVAVMGHSYGAFMTANLLAHTDFFRAGIARSGAYNRSLTPFGFQNEERTYWEAPDVYFKMSPFSYADKIKTPILLFHGEADNNTGTFPIQSERFYSALKGEGATVRFVLLPLEAHGYTGRESVLHMLWEMERWMDTYVKPETAVVGK